MPVQTTTVRHFQVPSAHTHTRARTHTHTRARAHAHTHAVLGSSTRSTSAPRPKAPATPGGDCQQRRKHVADSASAADIHPPAPLGWITAASSLQRRIPKAPATPKGPCQSSEQSKLRREGESVPIGETSELRRNSISDTASATAGEDARLAGYPAPPDLGRPEAPAAPPPVHGRRPTAAGGVRGGGPRPRVE